MTIMVMSATPEPVHAEAGCPDQDRLITAGSYFHLGWNCNVSGDVAMRTSGNAYQRLYDDDDASTGNIIRCTDINGCDVFANWGGYVSARDTITMTVDTFKYVPGLRYIDTRCFPASCGATRYFPSLTPPAQIPPPTAPQQTIWLFGPGYTVYGGTVWINGSVFCQGCIFTAWSYGYVINGSVQAPPPTQVSYTRFYFGAGTPIMGGWIYINGSYVGYSCYVPSAWGNGYVDGGSVWPQFYPGVNIRICGDTNPG